MNKPYIRFLIFLVLIAALIFMGKFLSIDKETIDCFLSRIPLAYSIFAFVFLYVIGTFLIWNLKDILKIVGAILFGAYLSTLLIYIAEIVNAYIFFNLSHVLGKSFMDRFLKGKLKGSYEKLGTLDLKSVFLLRAVPLIPYRILDLSFGLSKFPFRKYLFVVLIASPPRIFLFQFPLAAMKEFSVEKMIQRHAALYRELEEG